MKKLLSILAFTVLIITSCSNDNENIVDNNNDVKYPVTFAVSQFSSEVEPLKAAKAWPSDNYCQYVIYKEDGSVLIDKVMSAGSFDVNNVRIQEELPKGNYYLAVMSAALTARQWLIIEPSNYFTDYCDGNPWLIGWSNNQNIYYETISFTVSDQAVEKAVVLNPMWSELNIKVTDADICTLPPTTTNILFVVDAYYYGFGLKDKKATKFLTNYLADGTNPGEPVESFREKKGLFNHIAAESENVTVKMVFVRNSATENYVILGEKVVYTGNIAIGKRITFEGKVGNVANDNGAAGFGITLKDLEDGGTIPFD